MQKIKQSQTMVKWGHIKSANDYEFIEEVFEIAFGDDAINRSFSYKEVLDKLKEFSSNALIVEEMKESK